MMKGTNQKIKPKRWKVAIISIAVILLIFSIGFFLVRDLLMSSPIISLERTPCYGPCPVYQVTIYGSGLVVYRGQLNVDVKGIRLAVINHNQVKDLMLEFKKARYFSLEDEYIDYSVTDRPHAITSLTFEEKQKQIIHYFGDETAPKELYELEAKIDEIANSEQWICLSRDKTSKDTSRWCLN